MTVLIGEIAPDFETTKGPISFHDWIGDSCAWARPSRSAL